MQFFYIAPLQVPFSIFWSPSPPLLKPGAVLAATCGGWSGTPSGAGACRRSPSGRCTGLLCVVKSYLPLIHRVQKISEWVLLQTSLRCKGGLAGHIPGSSQSSPLSGGGGERSFFFGRDRFQLQTLRFNPDYILGPVFYLFEVGFLLNFVVHFFNVVRRGWTRFDPQPPRWVPWPRTSGGSSGRPGGGLPIPHPRSDGPFFASFLPERDALGPPYLRKEGRTTFNSDQEVTNI